MMPSLGIMNRMNSRPSDGGQGAGSTPPGCYNQKECSRLAGKDEPLPVRGNAVLIQDLDKKPQNSVKQLSFD